MSTQISPYHSLWPLQPAPRAGEQAKLKSTAPTTVSPCAECLLHCEQCALPWASECIWGYAFSAKLFPLLFLCFGTGGRGCRGEMVALVTCIQVPGGAALVVRPLPQVRTGDRKGADKGNHGVCLCLAPAINVTPFHSLQEKLLPSGV